MWSPEVRHRIKFRDSHCVGFPLNFPPHALGQLWCGPLEIDHVRASGALGKKSRSTEDNGVLLGAECHRWKTSHGKEARPLLLAYLARFYPDVG